MNGRKLSVNKACLFLAVLLLVAMGTVSAALYGLTQNITAVWYVVLFGIFVLLCAVCFAAALGGILLNAEKKQINVQVDCPENLVVSHDRKWTGEALFNILDNAVKYTPEGGQIRVSVESWEMYVKIDIADTGIGISEQHQGAIFKRFYREDIVHDVDGIGIGLYLAREIVTLQGGYIRVTSEVGRGSTFSVFLPRQ